MNIFEKEIFAIASDFDGTIIKKGMTSPPDKFYEVVEKIVAKGIPFVAASGREYSNLKRMLAPVADKINYIAANGCLVVYGGQVIYKSTFEKNVAMELIRDMLAVDGTDVLASGESHCYVLPNDPVFVDRMVNKIKNDTTIVSDLTTVEDDYIKISIHWKNEHIPLDIKQWFIDKYENRLLVVDGGNGWLDFNMKEAGKGPALEILAKHMNLEAKDFIAFGDNENDISMLKAAGISYAVTTAKPHVKEYANFECESVEDVLEELFLNN